MADLYLPDLNVLFAAFAYEYPHHKIARNWILNTSHFATCSITESGLMRLLANTAIRKNAKFSDGVVAVQELRAMSSSEFWLDDSSLIEPVIDTSVIAGYRQIPDFHLLNLAVSRGARLVTLDEKIMAAVSEKDKSNIINLGV